jgi:hypothetical protein
LWRANSLSLLIGFPNSFYPKPDSDCLDYFADPVQGEEHENTHREEISEIEHKHSQHQDYTRVVEQDRSRVTPLIPEVDGFGEFLGENQKDDKR